MGLPGHGGDAPAGHRSRTALVRGLASLGRVLALAAALTLLGVAAVSAAPEASTPAAPQDVTALSGSKGILANVSWLPGNDDISGYRVWRSSGGIAGFEAIGSTAATTFADASGIPGHAYLYAVTALEPDGSESELSTPAGPITATWDASPHSMLGKGERPICLMCHGGQDATGEVALCESCHDGQGARTNVKDGPVDSFALASGHSVEEATRGADLTNECSSCHSPHADPSKRAGLFRKKVDGKDVGDATQWCAACHDDRASWKSGYPSLADPTRDASGYPVLGTYPGPSVYADPKKNTHVLIDAGPSRPKGDCLVCHAAHRGPNRYDGLLATFVAPSAATLASDQADGAYAALCFGCHAGQQEWRKAGAVDIRRFTATPGAFRGHRIVTAGGTLPVGAPIPCYDCHNPHGSSRGNAAEISDALGEKLSTSSDADVRRFCLSCHASSDGKIWDSAHAAYAEATGTVEGLARDGSGGNALLLPAAVAEHAADSAASCYGCHGGDYGSATSFNVHAPRQRGESVLTTPTAAPLSHEKTGTPGPAVQVRR